MRQRKTPLPERGRHERIAPLPALDLPTGVNLHYDDEGPDDGPVVLCLHGWPQDARAWRRVAPLLSGTHRVIRPDTRGIGRSGPPEDGDFTKGRIADDALALLDALGIERVQLAGHDWGGWVAMVLALRAPERVSRLHVLSVPHPWQPTGRLLKQGWRFAYVPPIAAPVIGPKLIGRVAAMALKGGWGDRSTWDDEMAREYAEMTSRSANASSLFYRHFILREAGHNWSRERLAMPAHLMIGSKDPLGTSWIGGFERRGDAATTEVVEGAGHFLPEERPEQVAAALRG